VPQPDLTSPPTQGLTHAADDPSSPEFARMFRLIGTRTIEKITAYPAGSVRVEVYIAIAEHDAHAAIHLAAATIWLN